MKKGILLRAFGGEGWIGGLYYIKNIAYQLSINELITKDYEIYVYTTKENSSLFTDADLKVHIVLGHTKNKLIDSIEFLYLIRRLHIKYVFPMQTELNFLGATSVAWIPDFQHKYYPQFHSTEELRRRDSFYRQIASSSSPLVLSSYACKCDFEKFYTPNNNKKIFVVPFVSYIKEHLIVNLNEEEILDQYGLGNQKYIVVMNQFWEHKNHIVLLRALIKFYTDNDNDEKIVLTGKIRDDLDSKYLHEIKKLLNRPELNGRIYMLGFIPREHQIIIMKKSDFIVQPSLFEGWGTVVEDAKVLDKTILLSDIPVHREQMNEKCILFDPHNPEELAKLIQQECHKEHHDNIEKGIEDMKKRALEYSKGFEQLLRDQEMKS